MLTKNWKSLVALSVLALVLCLATTGSAATISDVSVTNSNSRIAFADPDTEIAGRIFSHATTVVGTAPAPVAADGISYGVWANPTVSEVLGSGVSVLANRATARVIDVPGSWGGDGPAIILQYRWSNQFYNSGPTPYELTFSGLDAGKSYLFQFGHYQLASDPAYNQTVTLTAGVDIATTTLNFGGASGSPGTYALLSATSTGSTTFNVSFPHQNNQSASINAFSVHELAPVPEPSTYALGLIGLAGLGLVVRRRKYRRA